MITTKISNLIFCGSDQPVIKEKNKSCNHSKHRDPSGEQRRAHMHAFINSLPSLPPHPSSSSSQLSLFFFCFFFCFTPSPTMPTITRKKLLNTVTAVDIGCSSCRRPRLFHMFRNKAKPVTTKFGGRKQSHHNYSSASSSYNKDSSTTTTFSPNTDDYASFSDHETVAKTATPVKGFGRVGGESVAVEKDSGDPYLDFRHSMLQMILENEIYSKDDLRELLNCFLQLNAPCNHGIIIRAFTDIWNGVFSVRSSAATMQLRLARKSHDY